MRSRSATNPVANPTHDSASSRTPSSSSAASSASSSSKSVARGHGAQREAALARRRHPRIHVRRELEIGNHDDVAAPERQPPRREVDPRAGVHRQRDAATLRADERRDPCASIVERGELLLVRQPVRRGALARVLHLRAKRALGKRAGARGVQVDRFAGGGPGKLLAPQSIEVVRHAQVRADGGASIAPLFAA